ncbi:hypothetical protein PFISCL1PPCAC_7121 [Pristionchus fissidentatus]|uniref:Probable glycerol kinase n=1 Tax=Pristionchus fissidentatus TaxID=1538716 RepID=A0AAV5VBI6_9BILA|nr:hypothetical protein PFISCL1PPCAC_7121 [Pristionchus fissidentatus]
MLLGAIDQGTSSSRFLVFDLDGEIVASNQIEVRQIFPHPGWVEMDPNELINTVLECIAKTCEKLKNFGISPSEIQSVGIANQRETIVIWDRDSGHPLYNAIVWLDTRTSQLAQEYIDRTETKSSDHFKPLAGLPIHPYFSALKLRWLLDNVRAVRESCERGSLMFGTVDSWLMWKLTGVHCTDVTNASRTLLFDLAARKWSTELCAFFQIPMEILPDIRSSAEIYGKFIDGPLEGTTISGCLGDQNAALLGQGCWNLGDTKTTFGTGTFMLCNTGEKAILSKNGLLTTVAFQLGSETPMCFALEGSGSIGGNVVRFLRDNFKFIKEASEIEEISRTVENTNGVLFVPCFTGLYTPQWDPTARGLIVGLTHCTTMAHICLAALRAVAFQCTEMIEAIENDMENSTKIKTLKADGGMTTNRLFVELQAEIAGRNIETPRNTEISAWGAAIAAAIGARLISVADFGSRQTKFARFEPNGGNVQREVEMTKWKDAVKRAQNWQK